MEVKSVDSLLANSVRDGHDKPHHSEHGEVVKEILKKKRVKIMPPDEPKEEEAKEESPKEKAKAEVTKLYHEAIKMAKDGVNHVPVVNFYNEKVLPALNLYGAEYLYSGMAEEMNEEMYNGLMEVLDSKEAVNARLAKYLKEKAEKKAKNS